MDDDKHGFDRQRVCGIKKRRLRWNLHLIIHGRL